MDIKNIVTKEDLKTYLESDRQLTSRIDQDPYMCMGNFLARTKLHILIEELDHEDYETMKKIVDQYSEMQSLMEERLGFEKIELPLELFENLVLYFNSPGTVVETEKDHISILKSTVKMKVYFFKEKKVNLYMMVRQIDMLR